MFPAAPPSMTVASSFVDVRKNELRSIVAMSEVPAFMRTSTKLDATVILGGAAGNIVGQNYGGDMMLWELFGSLAGLGLYGGSKAGTAAVFVKDLLRGANEVGKSSFTSLDLLNACLLYTSPSPRDGLLSRMPSSA